MRKKVCTAQPTPMKVKALVGKEVTISGFILPLESTEKFKHFILSKRTPTCPFCPPGEPNEIVDVMLDKPISWDEGHRQSHRHLRTYEQRRVRYVFSRFPCEKNIVCEGLAL